MQFYSHIQILPADLDADKTKLIFLIRVATYAFPIRNNST